MIDVLRNRIRAARGEIAPDLILKGGRVINVFTHEVLETDVAIYDGVVVGTGSYGGGKYLDTRGSIYVRALSMVISTWKAPCFQQLNLQRPFPLTAPPL